MSSGIECTAYLHTTERTVGEISAILSCKRNSLRNALVNDSGADFSKTIDVSLSTTIVTTLDGIVEKTVDRVIVILVVLRSIDTTLCCNRVRTTRFVSARTNLLP